MIMHVEKYCSVVSLLLMAGIGLILIEGPVTNSFAAGTGGPASVSVIYSVDANGRAQVIRRTSTVSAVKSVAHADGSVTTTDVAVQTAH